MSTRKTPKIPSSQVKMVIHHEIPVIFQDIEHQLQENILRHFLYYSFFIKFSLNGEISLIQS